MNINNAFPSTYVKAADLNGKRVTVTMDRVEMQDVGGDPKPVLYFQKTPKGLVLNKTNASIIAEMYGPDTDLWVGQQIILHPARVEFQGKIVDSIRVHLATPAEVDVQAPLPPRTNGHANGAAAPNGYAAAKATPPQQPAPTRGIDDEIPF